MPDIKTLVTIFLGVWTLAIVCVVVAMYASWEDKMLGDERFGRKEQGTTEALGKKLILEKFLFVNIHSFFFSKLIAPEKRGLVMENVTM